LKLLDELLIAILITLLELGQTLPHVGLRIRVVVFTVLHYLLKVQVDLRRCFIVSMQVDKCK
jgi:hypothetical protein